MTRRRAKPYRSRPDRPFSADDDAAIAAMAAAGLDFAHWTTVLPHHHPADLLERRYVLKPPRARAL